jgi:release factor glutamine methyltransferase
MPTVADLLADARRTLAGAAFSPSPREAALLLAHLLGSSEVQVLAFGEREVSLEQEAGFRSLLARRLAGEPVAYLFGEREFYGRSFRVDSRVLIPRPETEHLVEEALALRPPAAAGAGTRVLDIGTGSGCLAVTLALELPAARVVATDLSAGALAVAAGNARRLGAADRVAFVACDLAAALDLARFDLVVSNPPYIDPTDAPALSVEVYGFEPHLALFSPGTGDSTLGRLFAACAAGLRPNVPLLVEIGDGQLAAARRHAAAAPLDLVAVRNDYAGIPRVLTLVRR